MGDAYIDQVIVSASGLKKHNPDLKVALFSDKEVSHKNIDINIDILANHEARRVYKALKESDRLPSMKLMILHRSPFEKTLSLDSDTYVRGDISYIFDKLDEYDLLFTPSEICQWTERENSWRYDVTKFLAFSDEQQINAGVIAYKDVKLVRNFFEHLIKTITPILNSVDNYLEKFNDQELINFYLYHYKANPDVKDHLEGINWSSTVLDNKIYNATDRMWPALQKEGTWKDVKILHTGLVHYLKELHEGRRKYSKLTDHKYFDTFR